MIIINCAHCAAALPHDNTGCVRYLFEESPAACPRCQTRYCDATCRRAHWRDGHGQVCEEIARCGGAEQHHADQRYAEAAAAAIEACAESTAGHTCYICMADGSESGEGLVRGCACRGGNGYVHMSCLVRYAQAAVEASIARQPGVEVPFIHPHEQHWYACRLCEQQYHGAVAVALGWGGWKTYCGWGDWNWASQFALENLGQSLSESEPEEALAIFEILLARRIDIGDGLTASGPGCPSLATDMRYFRGLIADCLFSLERHAECLVVRREIWAACSDGPETSRDFGAAIKLGYSLFKEHPEECVELMRELIPLARAEPDVPPSIVRRLRHILAMALCNTPRMTPLDNFTEGVALLTEVVREAARVFGPEHPDTPNLQLQVKVARAYLNACRYQDEKWREMPRCEKVLAAHGDAMDELLAAARGD